MKSGWFKEGNLRCLEAEESGLTAQPRQVHHRDDIFYEGEADAWASSKVPKSILKSFWVVIVSQRQSEWDSERVTERFDLLPVEMVAL